jgi:hypothetical protein
VAQGLFRHEPVGPVVSVPRCLRARCSAGETGRFLGPAIEEGKLEMIVLGLVVLIVGYLVHVAVLWTVGLVLMVIGAILWLLGATGRAVGGRKHYW